ncbi:hypothetical protein ABFS82_03G084700 [Erythranthe guttata]
MKIKTARFFRITNLYLTFLHIPSELAWALSSSLWIRAIAASYSASSCSLTALAFLPLIKLLVYLAFSSIIFSLAILSVSSLCSRFTAIVSSEVLFLPIFFYFLYANRLGKCKN